MQTVRTRHFINVLSIQYSIVMEKISKSLGILMLMLAVFTVSSCSDDKDDTPAWTSLSGEYAGWSSASFKYSPTPMVTDNEKLTIAATDNKMSVLLVSNQWGTATFGDVKAVEEGTGFKLTGTGTASLGMHGSTSTYDCTLEGTVSKDKKTVSVVITYPGVMGGTTLTFTLGEAPAAKLLAGSYDGWTNGSCAYFSGLTQDGEELNITANEDGTVDVKLTSQKWGETTITGVSAAKTADGLTLSGSGKFSMSMGGSEPREYDCTLEGTVSSDKETYSVVFTLPAVMGGLNITFAQGEAPAEN